MGSQHRERLLLAELAAGDRRAGEELVERTYRRVFAYLQRLCGGDADLAADLTQEAYRRAWAGLAGFDGRARFATWLHRIAFTTFLNHLRRPRRLVAVDDLDGVPPLDPSPVGAAVAEPPDEALAAAASGAALRRAVMALPESLRFTVTARFWGELPVREIAEQEGITGVAVRKRLKKAMGLLAEALQETAS